MSPNPRVNTTILLREGPWRRFDIDVDNVEPGCGVQGSIIRNIEQAPRALVYAKIVSRFPPTNGGYYKIVLIRSNGDRTNPIIDDNACIFSRSYIHCNAPVVGYLRTNGSSIEYCRTFPVQEMGPAWTCAIVNHADQPISKASRLGFRYLTPEIG